MSTEKPTLASSQPSNNDTNNTQPQPRPQPQSTPSSNSTTKTPVTLSPDSHLDPSAYVRGTHTIKIGNNVLVHPRAHLISIHSPLTINSDSIITERSIIGGPIPNPNPNPDLSTPSTSTATTTSPLPSTKPTTIGTKVHIHPNVQIHSGATIGSHSIIESNATISHNITIGQHSKICAGATISRDVPDWTVVYGTNGELRRRRKPPPSSPDTGGTDVVIDAHTQRETNLDASLDADAVENARLKTMAAEREATTAILKKSAAKAVAGRTKR